MKLGTVMHGDRLKVVALLDDGAALLDLASAAPDHAAHFADMVAMVQGGDLALDAARVAIANSPVEAIIPFANATHRCPIMPIQYRDCLVFEEHLKNAFAQAEEITGRPFAIPQIWYEQPIYYKGNRFSFIGHEQDVRWPAYSDHMDLELELAIVIGKGGADIPAASAADHIWGYTILNDMTARDAQVAEMAGQLGPAKGKDFDTGNILGPWIATADEIAHPAALQMEVSVNGEKWGGGNSRDMAHSFADIIAHISRSETLHPGEVIGSGTVGTGCGLELGKRLTDGDRFDLTIEGIGTLTNTIRKET